MMPEMYPGACVFCTSFLGSEGDGVPDAVVAARGAGIRVVMITGDYLLTAIAIAKNASCLRFAGVIFICMTFAADSLLSFCNFFSWTRGPSVVTCRSDFSAIYNVLYLYTYICKYMCIIYINICSFLHAECKYIFCMTIARLDIWFRGL